jgi:hypothetical protein
MSKEKIAIVSAVPETILAFMSKHLQVLSGEYSTFAICSNAGNIPVERLIPDVAYIDIPIEKLESLENESFDILPNDELFIKKYVI